MNKEELIVIDNEDHTIGNILRTQLLKNNNTEFCAYKQTHPLENKIELYLSVSENCKVSAKQVFKETIQDYINKLLSINYG